jgi:hypothetical protein
MPKMILEFDLPEEREEAVIARSAGNYHAALNDWTQMLRNWDKYGLPEDWKKLTPEDLVHEIRQMWFETLRDHEVYL